MFQFLIIAFLKYRKIKCQRDNSFLYALILLGRISTYPLYFSWINIFKIKNWNIEWNTYFQKQIISTQGQQKIVDFWSSVGEQMSIKDLFTETNSWLVFQQQYESEYMGYSEQGSELAIRSIGELIKQAAPFGLRNLARQILIATIDPKVQKCLNLPNAVIPQKMIIVLLNSVTINFELGKDINY